MKAIFCLLTVLMLNKDCGQNKTADLSLNSETAMMNQDDIKISYDESTRGFYERIWIDKDSITVTNDRNHVEKMSIATPSKDWNELMGILNDMDVSALPNLEAPTSMRHYDGARFTTLSITQNDVETSTESFDHGHPPIAIETLVNKVLSMRKLVTKN